MRESEKFGKKPVRRSTSDESASAKVYRPRTAKPRSVEEKKKHEDSGHDSENSASDSRTAAYPKERHDRSDRSDASRPFKRDNKREGSERPSRRDDNRTKGDSQTYKPRTLKLKSTEKPKPQREESTEGEWSLDSSVNERGDQPNERFDKPKVRKTLKADRSSKPESERDSTTSQRYGRDKRGVNDSYSKPNFEKRNKPERDSYPKPKSSFSERVEESKVRKAPKKYSTPPEIENELKTDKDGFIRLNKFIANSGLCSRREADEFITKGQITVNGIEVRELGTKVKLTDEVRFKDKALDPEKKVYILLNKPKDYVTTVEDPNATRTVMELIDGACEQRVYPVGRLDRNSTGLLLFTNDGELTKQLTHPSFMKKKIYEVGLDRNVTPEDMETIRTGVEIEGEMIAADAIEYTDEYDQSLIGIEIHSGQNRIVRRIFEKLSYRVQKLDRVYFAGLTKQNLPRGKWRFLSAKEVNMLKLNRFK